MAAAEALEGVRCLLSPQQADEAADRRFSRSHSRPLLGMHSGVNAGRHNAVRTSDLHFRFNCARSQALFAKQPGSSTWSWIEGDPKPPEQHGPATHRHHAPAHRPIFLEASPRLGGALFTKLHATSRCGAPTRNDATVITWEQTFAVYFHCVRSEFAPPSSR